MVTCAGDITLQSVTAKLSGSRFAVLTTVDDENVEGAQAARMQLA